MFRLWRVVSTEGPRSRGQEAVLLALPPAQSGANAGCKEAAGSGAAALVTGSRRWPEHGPRLPAAFPVANLPIYFSSGDDRRMQRARATTARYGRDSASAGQRARGHVKQWSEGRRPQGLAGEPTGGRGGLLWVATVAVKGATNCLCPRPGRKRYLGFQADRLSCIVSFVRF